MGACCWTVRVTLLRVWEMLVLVLWLSEYSVKVSFANSLRLTFQRAIPCFLSLTYRYTKTRPFYCFKNRAEHWTWWITGLAHRILDVLRGPFAWQKSPHFKNVSVFYPYPEVWKTRELDQAAVSFMVHVEGVYPTALLDQTAFFCWQKKLL